MRDLIHKIPVSLLLAVAVIAIVESIVGASTPRKFDPEQHRFYPLNRVPTRGESIIQWQVARLLENDDNIEVFLIGDSSCHMGLRPDIVSEVTGLTSSNFGTFGYLYTEGHADLLSLGIERRGAPKVVVYHVSFYPLITSADQIERERWLPKFRNWTGASQGLLAEILPSAASRLSLRSRLYSLFPESIARLMNTPRDTHPSDVQTRPQLAASGGATFHNQAPKWTGPFDWEPRLHEDAIPGLRRIMKMAEESEFDLIIALNPLPELARTPRTIQAAQAFEEQIREVAAPYGRVHISDPLVRFYPSDDCMELNHLMESGARRNSLEMARSIKLLNNPQAVITASTPSPQSKG